MPKLGLGGGVNRSSFLVGDLLLGKLGETVVVYGNARAGAK